MNPKNNDRELHRFGGTEPFREGEAESDDREEDIIDLEEVVEEEDLSMDEVLSELENGDFRFEGGSDLEDLGSLDDVDFDEEDPLEDFFRDEPETPEAVSFEEEEEGGGAASLPSNQQGELVPPEDASPEDETVEDFFPPEDFDSPGEGAASGEEPGEEERSSIVRLSKETPESSAEFPEELDASIFVNEPTEMRSPWEGPSLDEVVDELEGRLVETVRGIVEERLPRLLREMLREEIQRLKEEIENSHSER